MGVPLFDLCCMRLFLDQESFNLLHGTRHAPTRPQALGDTVSFALEPRLGQQALGAGTKCPRRCAGPGQDQPGTEFGHAQGSEGLLGLLRHQQQRQAEVQPVEDAVQSGMGDKQCRLLEHRDLWDPRLDHNVLGQAAKRLRTDQVASANRDEIAAVPESVDARLEKCRVIADQGSQRNVDQLTPLDSGKPVGWLGLRFVHGPADEADCFRHLVDVRLKIRGRVTEGGA